MLFRSGRYSSRVIRRLGLAELAYDQPFFHMAIVAAMAAAAIRVDLSFSHNLAWTAYAGVPVSLALFSCTTYSPPALTTVQVI